MYSTRMMLLLAIAIFLVATTCDGFSGANLGNVPLENPDLFGGDMLGVDITDRNAIIDKKLKWPNGTIPYVLDKSVEHKSVIIQRAMEHYQQKTCITFVPRTTEKSYVKILGGQGCYSMVGMFGGEQVLSLGPGCMRFGIIVHELGHVVGFYHEQNRFDRDDYLIIYWENIMRGAESQFIKLGYKESRMLDNFDYNSIMLYGNHAFSKDGFSRTMVATTGYPLKDPAQKPGLSASDIKRIKKLYKC